MRVDCRGKAKKLTSTKMGSDVHMWAKGYSKEAK